MTVQSKKNKKTKAALAAVAVAPVSAPPPPLPPPVDPLVKGDPFKRTESQLENDRAFVKLYREVNKATLPSVSSDLGYAVEGAFVEVVRKEKDGTTKTEQVTLRPGVYRLKEATTLAKTLAQSGASPKEMETRLFEETGVRRLVVVEESASIIGKRAETAASTKNGLCRLTLKERPIAGTVLLFTDAGAPVHSIIESAAEYRELLPLLNGGKTFGNLWCVDGFDERVAPLADQAPAMLLKLREQTALLGKATEIYTVVPRWLRYFSDGTMESQQEGNFGLRLAPMGDSGARPMLYDGPAWCVGIRLGKDFLPGRVFVNTQGDFICSDWCQREVDKGGGIDLITGKNTKHSLLTWLAGPGMSRFGAQDLIIADDHQVRRLNFESRKVKKPTWELRADFAALVMKLYKLGTVEGGEWEGPLEDGTWTFPTVNEEPPDCVRFFVLKKIPAGGFLELGIMGTAFYRAGVAPRGNSFSAGIYPAPGAFASGVSRMRRGSANSVWGGLPYSKVSPAPSWKVYKLPPELRQKAYDLLRRIT